MLALNARYCDLLGLDRDTDPGIDGVSLSAGVPVLFIPKSAVGLLPGKRVVVGRDRGRESVRAVHDALPFLLRAQSVDVVSVSFPRKETSTHLSGADICRHFARLDVRANARSIRSAGPHTGVTLLSAAADLGAGLILMGVLVQQFFGFAILAGTH